MVESLTGTATGSPLFRNAIPERPRPVAASGVRIETRIPVLERIEASQRWSSERTIIILPAEGPSKVLVRIGAEAISTGPPGRINVPVTV